MNSNDSDRMNTEQIEPVKAEIAKVEPLQIFVDNTCAVQEHKLRLKESCQYLLYLLCHPWAMDFGDSDLNCAEKNTSHHTCISHVPRIIYRNPWAFVGLAILHLSPEPVFEIYCAAGIRGHCDCHARAFRRCNEKACTRGHRNF